MRALVKGAALTALPLLAAAPSQAADTRKTGLKPFNVTIRVFDPTKGMGTGRDDVVAVDSPNEEHAIASTTANAASFTTTMGGARPLPVAFICIKIEPRP